MSDYEEFTTASPARVVQAEELEDLARDRRCRRQTSADRDGQMRHRHDCAQELSSKSHGEARKVMECSRPIPSGSRTESRRALGQRRNQPSGTSGSSWRMQPVIYSMIHSFGLGPQQTAEHCQ